MSAALEINGKKLQPIKEAATLVSYSRDYVTRLARENKITATTVGRQWFVDVDSLVAYAEQSKLEQELRKKQLSDERKQEIKIKTAVDKLQEARQAKVRFLHVRAVVVTMFILCSGLLAGVIAHETLIAKNTVRDTLLPANQTASVIETEQKTDSIADFIDREYRTRSLRPIGDVAEGVLILPSGAATLTAAEVFSDEVIVREAADGTQTVVRVDQAGNEIGEGLPFVVVPVKQESK